MGQLYSIDNAAVASASEPASFITSATYNARGQTVTIAYGSGATASYTCDAEMGWMMRARAVQGGIVQMDQTYMRLANGQISAVAPLPNAGPGW